MQVYACEFIVGKNGELALKNLPFQAGEKIEVIIIPRPESKNKNRYLFWGMPITYHHPTEPVVESDWEVLG